MSSRPVALLVVPLFVPMLLLPSPVLSQINTQNGNFNINLDDTPVGHAVQKKITFNIGPNTGIFPIQCSPGFTLGKCSIASGKASNNTLEGDPSGPDFSSDFALVGKPSIDFGNHNLKGPGRGGSVTVVIKFTPHIQGQENAMFKLDMVAANPGCKDSFIFLPCTIWGKGTAALPAAYFVKGKNICDERDATNSKVISFMRSHVNDARLLAKELNVPVSFVLGLSGEESSYGTGNPTLHTNNFFGLDAGRRGPNTWRTRGGANYMIFPSYLAGGQYFVKKFGPSVRGMNDENAFAQALIPRFNTGNRRTGGNPGFKNLVTGSIDGVRKRMVCLGLH